MEKLIAQLRELLLAELGLETQLKEIKEQKEKLLEKLDKHIKGDSYSNEFVRIQRAMSVKPLTLEAFSFYGITTTKLDKDKICKALDEGVDVSDKVEVSYKLVTYKKANGLNDLSQDLPEA
jgi:hypothetical protein